MATFFGEILRHSRYQLDNTLRVEHLGRFAAVGGAAIVCHSAIVLGIVENGLMGPIWANAVGFLLASLVFYGGHFQWSIQLQDQGSGHGHHLARFLALSLGGLALNQAMMVGTVAIGNADYRWALLASVVLVPGVIFRLNRIWAPKPRGWTQETTATDAPVRPGRFGRDPFIIAVTLVCAVYTGLALSPSHYGWVRETLDLGDPGIIAGEPQMVRGDELGLWTPMVQILVENGFQRFNTTSPYGEDLRNFYGLPILDWGLAFKPQFWPFFLVDPGHAYSFYNTIHYALFLIGWYLLFRRLDVPASWSAASSLTLFFSSFVQTWWASLGPHTALAPWFLLAFLMPMVWWARTVLTGWIAAIWLMSMQFYPPLILSLALAGGSLVLAFRPALVTIKAITSTVVGAGIGSLIAAVYYRDSIEAFSNTVTHGARDFAGGQIPFSVWLGQLFPQLPYKGYDSLSWSNACEVSSAGSYLLVLTLIFLDWRALARLPHEEMQRLRNGLLWLGIPFAAIAAWMLLPLPSWIGKPFLWHIVPASRLAFAGGLLALGLALLLLRHGPVTASWTRFMLFASVAAGAWGLAKLVWRPVPFPQYTADLVVIPLALAAVLAARRSVPASAPAALVAVAATANFLGFGGFNPLQRADVIFEEAQGKTIERMQALQAAHPDGLLVFSGQGTHGAVLNGLGFRAANHAVLVPGEASLSFLRSRFREMSDDAFQHLFNRYSILVLGVTMPPAWTDRLSKPELYDTDTIVVPASNFLPPLHVEAAPFAIPSAPEKGRVVEVLRGEPGVVTLLVEGEINGLRGTSRLRVLSDAVAGVRRTQVTTPSHGMRLALGERMFSAVEIELELTQEVAPEDPIHLCLETIDPEWGNYRLKMPETDGIFCAETVKPSGAPHA